MVTMKMEFKRNKLCIPNIHYLNVKNRVNKLHLKIDDRDRNHQILAI